MLMTVGIGQNLKGKFSLMAQELTSTARLKPCCVTDNLSNIIEDTTSPVGRFRQVLLPTVPEILIDTTISLNDNGPLKLIFFRHRKPGIQLSFEEDTHALPDIHPMQPT